MKRLDLQESIKKVAADLGVEEGTACDLESELTLDNQVPILILSQSVHANK